MNWYRVVKVSMPVVAPELGLYYTDVGHGNYDPEWSDVGNPIKPEDDTNFVWIINKDYSFEMEPAGNKSHFGVFPKYGEGEYLAAGRYEKDTETASASVNRIPNQMSRRAYEKLVMDIADILEKNLPNARIMFFDRAANELLMHNVNASAQCLEKQSMPLVETPEDLEYQDIAHEGLESVNDGQFVQPSNPEIAWVMYRDGRIEQKDASRAVHDMLYDMDDPNLVASGRYNGYTVSALMTVYPRTEVWEKIYADKPYRLLSWKAYEHMVHFVVDRLERQFPGARIMFFDDDSRKLLYNQTVEASWYRPIKLSMPAVEKPTGTSYMDIGHQYFQTGEKPDSTEYLWTIYRDGHISVKEAGENVHSDFFNLSNPDLVAQGRYDGQRVSAMMCKYPSSAPHPSLPQDTVSNQQFEHMVKMVERVLDSQFDNSPIIFFDAAAREVLQSGVAV